MTQPNGSAAARPEAPKTILVVEDNELNMRLFADLLEARGYNVVKAWNGNDVLDLARQYRPNLIIMDIQLPGISGLEATRSIKKDDELKIIPIIAVTAFVMKGDEARIRECGCDDYVAKPISLVSFVSTVERFLDAAR